MKTFSIVASIIALAALIAALLSGWPGQPDIPADGAPQQTYPWQIELGDNGATLRVFDLVLGRSTLADAVTRFGEEPELAMFRRESGELAVEAYFGHLKLGMLLGKAVLSLRVPQSDLQLWLPRGNHQSISESGSLKATPAAQDRARINAAAIASLTFLPMVRLQPETIQQRFGEPEQRFKDDAGTEHWAWPSRGLDIALHQGRTKDVLQYRPPLPPGGPTLMSTSPAAAAADGRDR